MNAKEFARRLKNLSPRNDEEHRIFTFTLGAIYAAACAEILDYSETTEPTPGDLVDQARQAVLDGLSEGELPYGGRWAAGFYFNSALFRTDVAFERLVRYITRDYETRRPAKHVLPLGLGLAWAPIHKEVIGMKHHPHLGRRTPYGELLEGLDALIRGLEWCFGCPEQTTPPRVRQQPLKP